MIEIKIKGEALDLPRDMKVSIEETNPVYNELGSQSMPVTVPVTRRNIRLLDGVHRLDAGVDPNTPAQKVDVVDGTYIRCGLMNVTESGRGSGYVFNVGFDNSAAYAKWKDRKLGDLEGLPVYEPEGAQYPIDELLRELYNNYLGADPQLTDWAVFPVAINDNGTPGDKFWEVLNVPGARDMVQPRQIKRVIDGKVTTVNVPDGYGVSPMLRVWKVLDLVFNDLGLEVVANPFKADRELARLVVLNNVADSVCNGRVKYADLMPDCTVSEFLNSLWVRFGLVYNIDYRAGTVDMRLIKDIINQHDAPGLDDLLTEPELLKYEVKQYVKLSASTSITGAEPATARFEDFIRGLDVSRVRLGSDVSLWRNSGTADKPNWSGDEHYYDWYDDVIDLDEWPDISDPDWPDENDRDDGDRDGSGDERTVKARTADGSENTVTDDKEETFLAREYVSGKWYRLDANNGGVMASSSGFFAWDPQPEGYTALELTAEDECVPVARVNNLYTEGNFINDMAPLYLFGARHYHSYIKGSEKDEKDGSETPLAFMFAYTLQSGTIGRLNGEGMDGKLIVLSDGTSPTLSLLFQFKDGLFARFWAGYDEILRHGNRVVEAKARINKIDLNRLNLLDTVSLRNVRCLIDTATYMLPASREVSVELKLRTIQPHGNYDIKKEQAIPDFSAAARHLQWRLKKDCYTTELDTVDARRQAINNFKTDTGYKDHGAEGDMYYLSTTAVRCRSSERLLPTWQIDKTLPIPPWRGAEIHKTYKARLTYDIYEVHDMSTPLTHGDDIQISEAPIGQGSATVDYDVYLVARWVMD